MLLGSTVLDVAIGLIFVYLIVSFICSSLSEAVEAFLKHRSRDLERGIREMLTDTTAAPGSADIVKSLYNHPLISALYKGNYDTASKGRDLPSYIPGGNFTLALLDIVREQAAAGMAAGAAGAASVQELRTAAASFATVSPRVSSALVTLIDAAGNDLDRARRNIEKWFDNSMDRVSGWYKRRAQYIIFGFGLLLAIGANIDTVAIVRVLSTSQGLRQALVAQATQYAAKEKPAATDENTGLKDSMNRLQNLGLPLGWDENVPGSRPTDPNGEGMKVVGILLTAFAVSLGAPFWFDLLNKFIVVRSTVKPNEKSLPEPSKA